MKNIAAIALIIAATFIAAGPAPAQDHLVKATVPFDFTVGDRTLPAGTYTISSDTNSQGYVAIRNQDRKMAILTLCLPNQTNSGKDNTLLFHKYGNQYFLRDLRSEGALMNINFSVTKAEKRAKAQVEEARLSVNDPVLIALK